MCHVPCYSISIISFDSDLCQLFGLHPFTAQLNNRQITTALLNSDTAPIPIKGVIGDQQAALYSQWDKDKGKSKIHTEPDVLLWQIRLQIVTTNQLVSTIAIGANNHVDYAIEGVFTGGSLIQWLRDNLNIIDHVEESETLAKSIPSSDGVTLIPALTGLKILIGDP